MKAKYLEAFGKAVSTFTLPGNRILVERLEVGEVKTKGGLFIAESPRLNSDLKNHKPLVCVVLAVGEGYTVEGDEGKVPTDVQPGHVVVLNPLGVSFFSVLPGIASYTEMTVGITSESDVQMRFNSIESFEEYKSILEGVLNG
jgi:co-chaperonin GroES (HSP10)